VLRKAAAAYPSNAVFRRNLSVAETAVADVLLALGRKDEALAGLKQAQERFPENADLKKRLQSLPN
jgi:tetratricopeptide (TPR) repeat protein